MKLPPVITRSARRRRVAFTIRPEDGRLEVLAPLRASAAEIERIIAHNPDLIERLRRQFEQVEARRTVPEFREGGEFHYLGTLYPVRFTRKVLAFDRAFLIPAGDEAAVRTELEQLYRKLAAELLEPKVSDAAGRFGLTYRHVRVGGARGRWGSCSRDGGLNFSWRLVRWPEPVVDYVVVHELAHRIELNHSARYWREVERLCPGYRQLDRFLREHVPEYCPW
ncbi:M48 family metallopeptidase [Victivallis lenta]|uniref:M48 family metallopeptidase n=1 Tax=Victivallis lenta TaxID=2606640 RepID=UPI0012B39E9B|nr:SprT family zinc-dependent metalloprotease [Victivallis lenta]MBS5532518.1 M48 family metallopeptidase [bacterium]